MAVIHYLLVYDLKQQRLVETREFRDAQKAALAYAALETVHRGDNDLEIVLVGADSIDTIMQTHGQYFHAVAGQPDKYLVEVS